MSKEHSNHQRERKTNTVSEKECLLQTVEEY
jgi:hypothetical protein